MSKLFYSYPHGEMYFVGSHCKLQTLMHEHTGGDGLLIIGDENGLEIVEYKNFVESGFTTKIFRKRENTVDFNERAKILRECINELIHTEVEGLI